MRRTTADTACRSSLSSSLRRVWPEDCRDRWTTNPCERRFKRFCRRRISVSSTASRIFRGWCRPLSIRCARRGSPKSTCMRAPPSTPACARLPLWKERSGKRCPPRCCTLRLSWRQRSSGLSTPRRSWVRPTSLASPSYLPAGGPCCTRSPPECPFAGSRDPGGFHRGSTADRLRSCERRRRNRRSSWQVLRRPTTKPSRRCAGRGNSFAPAPLNRPTSPSRPFRQTTTTTTSWPCEGTPISTSASRTASRSPPAGRDRPPPRWRTIVLRGLSQSRVRRLNALLSTLPGPFQALPAGWIRLLPADAPLASREAWTRLIERLSAADWPDGNDHGPALARIVTILANGVDSAEEAGETLLHGRALAIWRRALRNGAAASLDLTLEALKFDDGPDPCVSAAWMPASALAASPRRYVRLLGLNSSRWPRGISEDRLLSDHIIPTAELEPLPVGDADRRDFATILTTTRCQVVLSCARRDSDGRLLGRSVLVREHPSRDVPAAQCRAGTCFQRDRPTDRAARRVSNHGSGPGRTWLLEKLVARGADAARRPGTARPPRAARHHRTYPVGELAASVAAQYTGFSRGGTACAGARRKAAKTPWCSMR